MNSKHKTAPLSSRWYVDFSCNKCGRAGTAHFKGIEMNDYDGGQFEPSLDIYCPVCRSSDILIEEIECYDQETEDNAVITDTPDLDAIFDIELERLKNKKVMPHD